MFRFAIFTAVFVLAVLTGPHAQAREVRIVYYDGNISNMVQGLEILEAAKKHDDTVVFMAGDIHFFLGGFSKVCVATLEADKLDFVLNAPSDKKNYKPKALGELKSEYKAAEIYVGGKLKAVVDIGMNVILHPDPTLIYVATENYPSIVSTQWDEIKSLACTLY